jgi:hypothetical protein
LVQAMQAKEQVGISDVETYPDYIPEEVRTPDVEGFPADLPPEIQTPDIETFPDYAPGIGNKEGMPDEVPDVVKGSDVEGFPADLPEEVRTPDFQSMDMDESARKAVAEGRTFEEWVNFMRGSATQYREYNPKLRALYGVTDKATRMSELGVDGEKEITIYRGVPDAKNNTIQDGDFITTDLQSAASYAGKENVVSKKVKAKDLIVDYPDEFSPEQLNGIGYEYIYSDSKNKIMALSESDLRTAYDKAKAEVGAKTVKINEIINRDGEAPTKSDVKAIMEKIQRGEEVPPILISPSGVLQDGRHRLEAYRNLGIEDIPVVVGYDPNVASVTRKSDGKKLDLETREYRGQKYKAEVGGKGK